MPSLTEVPGAIELIFLASSRELFTGWPSTDVITSPDWMPAFAAGLLGCGSATSAPSAFFSPRLSAISCVTCWICTPIQPRVTFPPFSSCAITVLTVSDGIAKPIPTEPPEGE